MKQSNHSYLIQNVLVCTICVFLFLIHGSIADAAGLLKPIRCANPDAPVPDSVKMKSHHVDVLINNGFVRTEVDQVFINDSTSDLEAIYTFPLPKQASLSELSLWIDEKEVIGEVLEKKKARQVYDDQKSQGNDTAVAEKDDFKTFDISVSPVRAQKETHIRFVYYQPVEIDLNIGRYVYPLEEGNVDDERIQFWSVDSEIRESFQFHLIAKSAFPVKDVRLPGFDQTAQITKTASIGQNDSEGDVFEVLIDVPSGGTLQKDIMFYYRLDDSVPARVELIPYRGDPDKPGTFMLVITPAASLQQIAEGTDWIFVLDRSGSMADGKIATLASGVSKVLGKLSPLDRFCIITFNERAEDFSSGYVQATPENVEQMIQKIKLIQAAGSTALFDGLTMGYSKLDADRSTAIILVTDGVCNVGPTEHSAFMKLLRKNDIRLFTFIIGNSANQPLMEKLAKESNGFAMNISTSDDIGGRLLQAKSKMMFEAMHDVRLNFDGATVTGLTPAKINSLYQGQQLVVFGRYDQPGDIGITLAARISGSDEKWTCEASLPENDPDNPEIERLWALARIDEIMEQIRETGETDALRSEIVSLGTEYSLVTDYTSMVVVKESEMQKYGIAHNNAQRVAIERQAQQAKAQAPVQNHRTDRNSGGGMFKGLSAPNLGSGPVGPLFIALLLLWKRIRRNSH